jgi:hypothetical protein
MSTAPIDLTAPATWATDTNYATGPDVGTPTKVDPGSGIRATGVIPASGVAAQHFNFNLHAITAHLAVLAAQAQVAIQGRLFLKQTSINSVAASDDGSNFLAALSVNNHIPTVVVKANSSGVYQMQDAEMYSFGGALSVITDSVAGGALRGTRYVVIGVGGTKNEFSTNNGDTWTAGGSTGVLSALVAICNSDTNLNVISAAGGSAYSTSGVAWTNPTAGNLPSDFVTGGGFTSVAALDNDILVAVGIEAGDPAFARSTNGGVTWALASGTVPNSTSHSDAGWVVSEGNNATALYHAGRRNVNTVDISTSTNGNTWTLITSLTSLGTVSGVKLMMCSTTKLLVVAMKLSTGVVELRASIDLGATWCDPSYVPGTFALTGFSVAAGRVYATSGDNILTSSRLM